MALSGKSVKDILDGIIDDTCKTNNDAPSPAGVYYTGEPCFDHDAYKEKMSFLVLKDIIGAMMRDETQDCETMIDASIMNHIKNDYKGTCYGYLCGAKRRLNSPLLASIVQEIEEAATDEGEKFEATKSTKDPDEESVKDMLDGVESYKDFREKLSKKVADEVVDDVSKFIIDNSKSAPTFDGIDDKLKKKDEDENATEEDTVGESLILDIQEKIYTESCLNKVAMSYEESLEKAIIEYCVGEMDYLFSVPMDKHIITRYRR